MVNTIASTVGALFINRQRQVLLGRRAPWKPTWPAHWDTIGGRVENNESLEAALIRECREEVGVTPTRFWMVANVPEKRPDLYGHALHHVYAVTDWNGGEPRNICDEHSELRWFTLSEMRRLPAIVDPDYPAYVALAIANLNQ